jgi:signal transduction histidine kinase
LPAEVTGSGHGWLTAYRRYPVFGVAWARRRLQVFGGAALLAVVAVALTLIGTPPANLPWGGLVSLGVQLLAPLLLGPWLGSCVRRQGWAPRQEWLLLWASILALVVAMLAFHEWGSEPVKQWIAEGVGQVDEQGQRRRVRLAIGVSVSTPGETEQSHKPPAAAEAAPAAPGAPGALDPMTRLSNGISSAVLTFWLGGGAALWGWRRERAGLAALAQARELAHAQARRREAELRLSVLAAQVEPHFLFNTLAGVRSAISTDPPRASVMIDRLVDYLRAAIPRLRSDGGAQATLGSQLDIVRAYLGLMAARMPRLQFHIDVPADLLGAPCPPLMLISLAENAVRHGVEPKIGPACITVSAQRGADGSLHISVADDGAGFGNSTAGTGLGLANIRERLQQMYEGRAGLELKARPEGGVAATITLPLE